MITRNEVIEAGKTIRTHTSGGAIVVALKDINIESLPEFIIISIDNILSPFRIQEYTQRSATEYIIKLLGIDKEVSAQHLCRKDVFFLRSDIDFSDEENENVIGFAIYHKERMIGTIADIDDTTPNILFVLTDNTLLPAHEDLIEDIDYENKIIRYALPEGLMMYE